MSREKGFDEFPSESGTDHFSPETEDIHVVVFYALVSAEDIVDQPCADTWNLVRSDRGTDSAATKRDPAFYLTGGNSSRQRDDEVRIVVGRNQFMRTEIRHLVPRTFKRALQLLF